MQTFMVEFKTVRHVEFFQEIAVSRCLKTF